MISNQRANNPAGDTELQVELAFNLNNAQGMETTIYPDNPFLATPESIEVGGLYRVKPDQFANFTGYALNGGIFGWGDYGVPDFIVADTQRLVQALSDK